MDVLETIGRKDNEVMIMTRKELELDWEVSSYNEDTDCQLDYYMDSRKNNIGDTAYLYDHSTGNLVEMEIINIIPRSENPKYYDELVENNDCLIDGEVEFEADTSAEFIVDWDCYLVWFKYI